MHGAGYQFQGAEREMVESFFSRQRNALLADFPHRRAYEYYDPNDSGTVSRNLARLGKLR